jgi:ankyrin repeat protein
VFLIPGGAAGAQESLVSAVRAGDTARIAALLDAGAPVNTPEADGTTALHWAAHRDDMATAERLIRLGADATRANRYGVMPISVASLNGSAAMIEFLLDAGASPNTELPEGETALMTAARTGRVDAVRVLLDRGAEVNHKETWRGQTALMWAAAEGHTETVQLLVERGANIHEVSNGGFTPLLFAARQGQIGSVLTLLELGADLEEALPVSGRQASGDDAPQHGLNAFLLAAANAHHELAALLLDRGADPNAAPLGWTALHQVSWVRKMGVAGSNNPAPEGSGTMTSIEFVRKLVEHGADINGRVTRRPPAGITSLNMIDGTPFLLAARTADFELMRLLVELGADPGLTNEDGTTVLMVAAGVGTNSPGEDPGTPAEVLEAVKVAFELGGDINSVDSAGNTAMHGAAYKHVPEVVRFLSEHGARMEVWNQPNAQGHTPLSIAEGIQRGMNIVGSAPTAAAIREVLDRPQDAAAAPARR